MTTVLRKTSSWHEVHLEDVVDQDSPICYGIVLPGDHVDDGVPVVKVKDIAQGGIRTTGLLRTSPDIDAKYKRSRLRGGDILLSIRGTVGRLGVVPDELTGANITQDTARIRISCAETRAYVYQALQSGDLQVQMRDHVVGQAVKGINIRDVKRLTLLLPTIRQAQKYIAELLTTQDIAIQKAEQVIAAKERHYSYELSRLISRGQHAHANVGTIAKEVPANYGAWRTVALSDIATIWKGQQLNKDAMVENGAYYALNGGIKPSGRTTEWNCEADTITISEGGNSCGFVSYNREPFWCGGHCYALKKLAQDVDANYLFHYLKGKQARVMALRVGSGLPNIQKSDLEAFLIVLPDLATQTAIAQYLNVLREEMDLLGQSVSALKIQKRGLMQKLLTGQWRVPETKAGREA